MIDTSSIDPGLEQSLRACAADKQTGYTVRTRHLTPDGRPQFINRLIREDSPYLLQHAHNPVNWYAWHPEAFQDAQRLDRPIFLSIGYSTCHWCHVMEEESFDNPEIAAILNRHFISIKLDREQYPDIDDFYMTAVQFISGQGGWPMSNFLLPDGKPFFAATYFPPQQFAAILKRVNELWHNNRQQLSDSADKVSASVGEYLHTTRQATEPDLDQARVSALRMLAREDRSDGGLSGAPKFPQEPLLVFFLDCATRDRDPAAAGFVDRALRAMSRGGLYDQVAGGFHRYSTDARWLVPHFEKMLYNQSQLSRVFLDAWRLTRNPLYRRVAVNTLDYVLREMQLPEGGFYSATDADSEGEEGRYFTWSLAELRSLLDAAELTVLQEFFALSEAGNFEGANILSLTETGLSELEKPGQNPGLVRLDRVLLTLRGLRERRIPPLRDDKRIVSWSSAMAASLIQAGVELANNEYLAAGRRALDHLWQYGYDPVSGLRRIYLNGQVSVPGQLEDYANLCQALIAWHDASGESVPLERASLLMDQMLARFWIPETGGFFNNPQLLQGPSLPRSSHAGDGAVLSAIAVALHCLVALWQRAYRVGRDELTLASRINQCIAAHGAAVLENPPAHVSFIRAALEFRHGSTATLQYAGGGRIRLTARRVCPADFDSGTAQVNLTLDIAAGWHLRVTPNAVVATALGVQLDPDETAWRLDCVTYPASTHGSQEVRGTVVVDVHCSRTGVEDLLAGSIGLMVQVQPCGDSLCLAAEELRLRL